MGRVVITHSTYIKGLIKKLKILAEFDGIKTVTPGVISKTRGSSSKLSIKISVKTIGGYKLIARKGTSIQEVFVVTRLRRNELETKINELA
tara:strand:+ start:402 stop:674 length:273 start_codon:yes stop_codon:yes gene_type:complete